MTAIRVRDLTKVYGEVRAVDGVDLDVADGEFVGVLGPNGAGKTTLLEVVEGLRRPDSGTVEVLGEQVWPRNARVLPRIGVQLQASAFFERLTAREQIRTFAALYDVSPARADEWLERVGLGEKASARVEDLSGGQAQRLSIACALVHDPELVFLDEPTAGLDPQARHATWELVEALRADGVTTVLTTHLLDEAERLADDVVVVDHGRVVAAGTVRELTTRGSTGQLRFAATPGLDVDQLLTALPPGWAAKESPAGQYLVEGPHGAAIDPQVLATVTAWCATNDAMAADLRIESRSLEDVFLELTGRGLRT